MSLSDSLLLSSLDDADATLDRFGDDRSVVVAQCVCGWLDGVFDTCY